MDYGLRILVPVRLLATKDGGPTAPIRSGAMIDWDMGDRLPNGLVHTHPGSLVRVQREPLSPGEECEAEIEPLISELWDGVKPGDNLTMLGSSERPIGNALVLSMSTD
jgi:hypothetical protein